jgi:hypothetical protein
MTKAFEGGSRVFVVTMNGLSRVVRGRGRGEATASFSAGSSAAAAVHSAPEYCIYGALSEVPKIALTAADACRGN